MPTTGTGPERLLESALRAPGLLSEHDLGWELNPRDLGGACPDLFWRHRELAVYVDGCQWHGCPVHYRPHTAKAPAPGSPATPHGLTREGVARQKHTDRVTRRALEASGKRVLVFWEHDVVRSAARCARQIAEALRR